jgi:hypothetical protein
MNYLWFDGDDCDGMGRLASPISKTFCLVLFFCLFIKCNLWLSDLQHYMLQAPGEQLTMCMDLPVDYEELAFCFGINKNQKEEAPEQIMMFWKSNWLRLQVRWNVCSLPKLPMTILIQIS